MVADTKSVHTYLPTHEKAYSINSAAFMLRKLVNIHDKRNLRPYLLFTTLTFDNRCHTNQYQNT